MAFADRVQLNLGKQHTTFADSVHLGEAHMLFKHLPIKAGWKKRDKLNKLKKGSLRVKSQ